MKKSIFNAAILLVVSAAIMVPGQTRRPPSPDVGRAAAVVTDRRVYSEGQSPALPRAGGKFVDPSFGTTIMRVTDESDGTSCNNFYSYWPTFNLDSTRFFL